MGLDLKEKNIFGKIKSFFFFEEEILKDLITIVFGLFYLIGDGRSCGKGGGL